MSKREAPDQVPDGAKPRSPQSPKSPKRQRQTILSNNLTPTVPTLSPNATVSPDVEDRKSRFRGYFIPLSISSQITKNRMVLTGMPDLMEADHKIMAWRVGRTTGWDDDGEKFAGRKLLELLVASEDEGLLCVARWYGGIQLGPVRFDHIIHVAADALATYHIRERKTPLLAAPTIQAPKVVPQVPSDEEERNKTIRTLKGKDMTIETLRSMITAKKAERGESPVTSPVKEKNYDRMSVEGLKRLLIARDATIKSLRDILNELSEGQECPNKGKEPAVMEGGSFLASGEGRQEQG